MSDWPFARLVPVVVHRIEQLAWRHVHVVKNRATTALSGRRAARGLVSPSPICDKDHAMGPLLPLLSMRLMQFHVVRLCVQRPQEGCAAVRLDIRAELHHQALARLLGAHGEQATKGCGRAAPAERLPEACPHPTPRSAGACKHVVPSGGSAGNAGLGCAAARSLQPVGCACASAASAACA